MRAKFFAVSLFLISLLFVTNSLLFASSQPYLPKYGINFAVGNKYHVETDFSISTPVGEFAFRRTYNSQSAESGLLGYGWTTSFEERIISLTDRIILVEAGGRDVHFTSNGTSWVNQHGKVRTITETASGFELLEPDGTILAFASDGRIISKTDRNGNQILYSYNTTSHLLESISDNFGNEISLAYNGGRLQTLTTPVGSFTYAYEDGNDNLTKVTAPDSTYRQYRYEGANDVHNLTGIIDETNIRTLTAGYDENDRVTSSSLAGGTEPITINYSSDTERIITQTTDGENIVSTYQLVLQNGVYRVSSFAGPSCSACGSSTGAAYLYNSRQQVEQVTDARDNITRFTYYSSGNRESETEAYGTQLARTTTWTYHPDSDRIATVSKDSVSNPGQQAVTILEYDAQGNLYTRNETGFNGSVPISRTTTYSHDTSGRIDFIDGPRTDVNDVTDFSYYPDTDPEPHNRYQLRTITNALGHVTTYDNYNRFGKPELIVPPYGESIILDYDVQGRLQTKTQGSIVITYDYYADGMLHHIYLPDSRSIEYTYTESNKIKTIADTQNNKITYHYDTYETHGKPVRIEIHDPDNQLQKYIEYSYEQTGDLDKTIHLGNTLNPYEDLDYDTAGNLKFRTDALGRITEYVYDELNRREEIIEPGAVTTGFDYDGNDNLKTVTDANGNATTIFYDDFGRKTSRTSPDTGLTQYEYDQADNLKAATDANGITVNYEYDALNRPKAVRYPDSSQDITYTYDESGFAGLLTTVIDSTGTTTYQYDQYRRLEIETRSQDGLEFPTSYQYNNNSEIIWITFSSGRIINYNRNVDGRIENVTTTYQEITNTLAENITYKPFGPRQNMTLGNGLTLENSYNLLYRLESTKDSAGSLYDRTYQYHATGNVWTITDAIDAAASQEFGYDDLGRLQTAQGKYGDYAWEYDNVGNRLSEALNTEITSYSYPDDSNKLAQVMGQAATDYGYDNAGNIISIGDTALSRDQGNRLASVEVNSTPVGEYGYDHRNLRTESTTGGETVYYVYDHSGNLISEVGDQGTLIRDYVYLDGRLLAHYTYNGETLPDAGEAQLLTPLASTVSIEDTETELLPVTTMSVPDVNTALLVQVYLLLLFNEDQSGASVVYYINDHLGTPQMLLDSAGQIVWQGNYSPFGGVDIVVNTMENNFRFPGQYFDAETGLHYNWHRYYDPATGRYISADPIGLEGGINLYAFANLNPVNYTDPDGLFAIGAIPAFEIVKWGGAALIAALGAKAAKETADAINDSQKTCEDDPCDEIIRKINEVMKELHRRYLHQCKNKKNQWNSHVPAFEGKKRQLAKLVAEAESKGCTVPPKAYQWLNTTCPAPGTPFDTTPGY